MIIRTAASTQPFLMTLLILAGLLPGAVPECEAAEPPDWLAVQEALESSTVDTAGARTVGRMRLLAGPAKIDIVGGVVYPVTPAGGTVREVVFSGRGKIHLDPRDRVERGHLRIFTGGERLAETFKKAVLVLANEAAVNALLSGNPVPGTNTLADRDAAQFYETWKASPERKRLNVDGRILTDMAEDGRYDEYFSGWFEGSVQGRFYYSVEPGVLEQVNLGQFVPVPMSEWNKRNIRRAISREQDKGRSREFDVSEIGDWDDWISMPLTDENGTPKPGKEPFEAVHYRMDVEIVRRTQELKGIADIEILAATGGRSVVPVALSNDMGLDEVRLGPEGPELFHQRRGREILVFLPEAPEAGERIMLRMKTSGRVIEKESINTRYQNLTSLVLRSTVSWFPLVGDLSRATYDVKFRYPHNLDLVASGRLVDSGRNPDGSNYQHRKMEMPVLGYTFEVGDFRFERFDAGHVQVTLALDPVADLLKEINLEDLKETIRGAIVFYEEKFGPYPLDYMTFATKPRFFSQGMLSLLTLSSYMLSMESEWREYFELKDPRTVIAHEIAHQWWGNIIGWKSYRDQWISEAMANYSAVLFAREELDWEGDWVRIGPTANWRSALGDITDRGVRVDSMGPVILGNRLSSSKSRFAYYPIVYQKGAVVLDMLARWFRDEDLFHSYMRRLVAEKGNRTISTEEFMDALSRYAGADMTAFTRRYIHGTGIPEIYYSLEFESRPGGGWAIRGDAVHRSPLEYRYRIGRTAGGALDVFRTPVETMDAKDTIVIAPLHIAVVDPEAESQPGSRKGKGKNKFLGDSNALITGRLKLEGERTEIDIPIGLEPKAVWLDVNHEVYSLFYDSNLYPRKAKLYEGESLLAAGNLEEAEAKFREALHTPFKTGDDLQHPEMGRGRQRTADKMHEKAVTSRLHIHLARLCIDQERLDEAREWMQFLDSPVISNYAVHSELWCMKSRLNLRRGEYRKILDRLMDYEGFDESRLTDHGAEAYALLAIAAKAESEREIYRKALRQARRHGVDVTELIRSP